MVCEAQTYSDGSWRCQKCDISGDSDENFEDFCKERLGTTCEDEGYPQYGTAHAHPPSS